MGFLGYMKDNGIKHVFNVIYQYKLELILEKIVYQFTKKRPLKDIIMIESHSDFDCNGGAFYDYLIENGYNKKYKIVWFVRNKISKQLPENVSCVPLLGPSVKKAYYVCTAKYFTFDCEGIRKVRKDQLIVYCGHGIGGLKSVKGIMKIPDSIDYLLVQSDRYAPIQADQWSIKYPDKRLVAIGYPAQDTFFDGKKSYELEKITKSKYLKTILWMPTFRRGGGYHRNDSTKEQKLGIPLIGTIEEYKQLNEFLKGGRAFLIIKIHPKQELSSLGISDMSNIKVLTNNVMKKLDIDNYRMMKSTDALISDYSGAAYEYLQLDRPIAYVLDDVNEYKRGFVVEDIHKLMAGHEIYNIKELYGFISDVLNENDIYKEYREKLRDYIYKYHDCNSSERLAKLMKLNEDNYL